MARVRGSTALLSLAAVLVACLLLTTPVVQARCKASRAISEIVDGNVVVLTSWEKNTLNAQSGSASASTSTSTSTSGSDDDDNNGSDDGDNTDDDDDDSTTSKRHDKGEDKKPPPMPPKGGPKPGPGGQSQTPPPKKDDSGQWCSGSGAGKTCYNATSNNPNNDKSLSTLRIVLQIQDNEIYLVYYFFSSLIDPDTKSFEANQFKYMLRLGKLIEYAELNGNSGYQASDDHLVQTYDFSMADPFIDWQRTIDSRTGAHVYTTSNGMFTFTARVSADAFTVGDQKVYPDEVKFDILISNFPYKVKTESYLALVGWVQSDMAIVATSDDRIDLDGTDAYITWVPTCDLDTRGKCSIALGAVYDDPDNLSDDNYDNQKPGQNDQCKATVWSFITNGSHPATILWDPTIGSRYAADTDVAGPAANSAQAIQVMLALVFFAVAAMLAL